MADRYQDDENDRGDEQHTPSNRDSDPLAELARLIGQTDPFAMGRANQQVTSRGATRDQYQPSEPAEPEDVPAAGPPQDHSSRRSGRVSCALTFQPSNHSFIQLFELQSRVKCRQTGPVP